MAELETIGHWSGWVGGLQTSSKDFYTKTEEAIKARKVPDCKISRITHSEGGLFSSSREYLRVERKDLIFDICAAPFGTAFFVSWWLLCKQKGVIGTLLDVMTYYKVDTASMFQSLIHDAVLEVLDDVSKAEGKRSLGDADRKPVMKDLFTK